MKLRLIIVDTKPAAWVGEARAGYQKKIGAFAPFEILTLKGPAADRGDAARKRAAEGELILKKLGARDGLILFDEGGKVFRDSEDFAAGLSKMIESGRGAITFCIGGPYGFDQTVLRRADARWSLSPLTLNHWLASVVALEQIYRGFTILRGLPYHNR